MTRRLCALALVLLGLTRALVLIVMLVLCARWVAAGTSDTAEPVPGPPFSTNATFLTDLQTFLRFEDGARFSEQFQPFIVTGCLGPTSLTLTHTPSACLGYPGGLRTKEVGSISYSNGSTCWVILHRDTVGSVTGPGGILYTRVPSTHYAVNCTAPALPATPADSVMLMKVTTAAGAITAVMDIRQLSPINTQTAAACSVSTATCLPPGTCATGTCCLPTASVCDLAIISAKLADAAVTTPKLAAVSVSNSKLADAAVSTAKIFPGATVTGFQAATGVTSLSVIQADGERTWVQMPALTTRGGLVVGFPQLVGELAVPCNGLSSAMVKVYRDATLIRQLNYSFATPTATGCTGSTQYPVPAPSVFDAAPAGAHVYKITVTIGGNGTFRSDPTDPGAYFVAELS